MNLKALSISFGPLLLSIATFVLISQGIIDMPGGEKSPIYGIALVILALLYLAIFWLCRITGKSLKICIWTGVGTGLVLFVPCTIGLIIVFKNI